MSSDVHLGGRGGGKGGRKGHYSPGPPTPGGYEYYGEHQEWWDDSKWAEGDAGYSGYDPYYEDYTYMEGVEGDPFEIDLYSLVFTLDENLNPKDLFVGIQTDVSSLMFPLEATDIQEIAPTVARALRIHPEPPPRSAREAFTRQTSGTVSPAGEAGGTTPPGRGGNRIASHPASPVQGPGPASITPNGSAATPETKVATSPFDVSSAAAPSKPPKTGEPLTPGSSGEGKIVMNRNQVEHLKQKMQAIRQRRSITPGPLPDEKPGEIEDPAATPDRPAASRTCLNGHPLKYFLTPEAQWWCSVCNTEHEKGTPFFGCRDCDWDACMTCAVKPGDKGDKGEAQSLPQTPRTSPARSPKATPKQAPTPPPRPASTGRNSAKGQAVPTSSSGEESSAESEPPAPPKPKEPEKKGGGKKESGSSRRPRPATSSQEQPPKGSEVEASSAEDEEERKTKIRPKRQQVEAKPSESKMGLVPRSKRAASRLEPKEGSTKRRSPAGKRAASPSASSEEPAPKRRAANPFSTPASSKSDDSARGTQKKEPIRVKRREKEPPPKEEVEVSEKRTPARLTQPRAAPAASTSSRGEESAFVRRQLGPLSNGGPARRKDEGGGTKLLPPKDRADRDNSPPAPGKSIPALLKARKSKG